MSNFKDNHHPNSKYKTLDDLFTAIQKTDDCWIWLDVKDKLGYGRAGKRGYAHKVVYDALISGVPEGFELDHTCRNPSCVNPGHLEPVSHKENVHRGAGPTAINAKKTHCKRGHELTNENVRITVAGGRLCLTCYKAYQQERTLRIATENRAKGLTAKGTIPLRPYRIGARNVN